MKVISTLLVLIVATTAASAQDSGRLYFDAKWQESDPSLARYYRDYRRISDTTYRIEDFYISGVKQMDAVAKNYTSPLEKVGLQTCYWENEQPSLRVAFVDGKRHGPFAEWHANGLKASEGSYLMGVEDGTWRWWSDGAVEIKSAQYDSGRKVGTWVWTSGDGSPFSRIKYDNGVQVALTEFHRNGAVHCQGRLDSSTGLFVYGWFDSLGTLCAIEKKRNGRIVDALYYNEDGSTHSDTSLAWREPQLIGTSVEKAIRSEVVYPELARRNGIEGRPVIALVISATGRLINVEIAQSDNKILDDEALRVAKVLTDWEPGIRHNRTAECRVHLPIQFKLND